MAAVALLAASACASPPPDRRLQLDAWLGSGSHAIGVTASGAEVEPSLVSRESTVASGIGSGAGKGFAVGFAGAGQGLASACRDGLSCIVVLALLPVFGVGGMVVGAVHGGATAEPIETVHALDAAPNALEVAALVGRGDALANRLQAAVARATAARTSHTGVNLPSAPETSVEAFMAAGVEGVLDVELARILIVGAPDDSDASLELVATPQIRYPGDAGANGFYRGPNISYRTERRPLADRLDASKLRGELDEAIAGLAADIVDATLVRR